MPLAFINSAGMADEPAKILLGDTIIGAGGEPPRRGRGFFRRKKEARPPLSHCENCGAQLQGHWCSQCGQSAIDYRRSFRHVIADVLDNANLDWKSIAAIGYLLIKPWKLTAEFLAGHRAHAHPLRLYVITAFCFFWVVTSAVQRKLEQNSSFEPIIFDNGTEFTPDDVHEPKPGATPPIDRVEDKDEDSDSGDLPLIVGSDPNRPKTTFELWLNQRIIEKIGRHGSKGRLFLKSLIDNLPWMMVACVPLFAFVLKILYIFRRVHYVDHLIYAMHVHSFAYLATLAIWAIGHGVSKAYPPMLPLVLFALISVVVIQIFLSIRKVYRQGWIMTVFKFFLGGFVYFFVLLIGLGATTFITIVSPSDWISEKLKWIFFA